MAATGPGEPAGKETVVAAVVKMLDALGVESERLDELVFDVAYAAAEDDGETDDCDHLDGDDRPDGVLCHWEGLASEANNIGLDGQVGFLYDHLMAGGHPSCAQIEGSVKEHIEKSDPEGD